MTAESVDNAPIRIPAAGYRDTGTLGCGPVNANLLGKLASVQVVKRWGAVSETPLRS
jgi:hypothetical protein